MAEERKDLLPLLVLGGLVLLGARRAEARKPEEKPRPRLEVKMVKEEKEPRREKPKEKPPEERKEPVLRIVPIEAIKVREEPERMRRKIEIETPLGKLEIRETPLGKIIQPPIGVPIVLPGQFVGEFVDPIARALVPIIKDVLRVVRL